MSQREHRRTATEFAQTEGAYARDGAGPGGKRKEREGTEGGREEGHRFRRIHVAAAGKTRRTSDTLVAMVSVLFAAGPRARRQEAEFQVEY